jgi:hypothetical protein
MNRFKPSKMFFNYIDTTIRILKGKEGCVPFWFLWIFIPILPACIFGWYIADITCKNLED